METLLLHESPYIVLFLSLLVILCSHTILAYLFIVIIILLAIFYRYEPLEQNIPDNIIISPANGVVRDIIYKKGYCYVSIYLDLFDRHYQVYPANGKVINHYYDQTGKYALIVDGDKSRDNEKIIHTMVMKNYKPVQITQIAGFIPRRISADNKLGPVRAGQYLGIIKFGSRVDLLFSHQNAEIHVQHGQKINIGDTIVTFLADCNL